MDLISITLNWRLFVTIIKRMMRGKVFIFSFLIIISLIGCGIDSSDNHSESTESEIQSINNIGSDTMVNLALAWAEEYQTLNPNVRISVTGGGSGTGITALINQSTDIANASRAIKSEEIDSAKANGVEPIQFTVSRDAIAIIVNPNNPIERLTMQEISDIYSGKINNWKELGGEDRPIVRLSRETNSGTHVYFLETVLRLGQDDNKTLFSPDTLLLPSSEGIIAEVRDNPNTIGYDGLGYVTPDVKVIAVAKDNNSPYELPSTETVNNKSYPIARDLYVYTSRQPVGVIKDYIDWILSPDGQAIVSNLGFVPILVP